MFSILLKLIGTHYLCDFALQNDFVANNKARGMFPYWYHVMTAHCAIHALGVLLVTRSPILAGAEFVLHFLTDTLKCEKKISFDLDQAIHLACKGIYFLVIFKGLKI